MLVEIIYNQMEVIAHHRDPKVYGVALQTQYLTEILKNKIDDTYDFEVVRDLWEMVEKKFA